MDEQAPSARALPTMEMFKAAEDSFYNAKLDEFRANGISLDVLQDPEVQAELRNAYVRFSMENMGPGTDVNYEPQIIAEGLRRLGYSDEVSSIMPSQPRVETIEEAAKVVAEIKREREKLAEDAADLNRRATGVGEMIYARQAFDAVTTDLTITRAMPAMIGTALQAVEHIPFTEVDNPVYDPRAAENRRVFADAVRYSVPGWELPGVKAMTDAGVPHWIADIVVEDVLDPASWVGGKPLMIAAAAGAGIVGFSAARLGVKTLRAAARNGVRISADEAIGRLAPALKAIEQSLGSTPFPAIAERADVHLQINLANRFGDTVAESAFREFEQMLGPERWRRSADNRFLKLVSDVYDAGRENTASTLLELRLGMATSADELADFQVKAAAKLGKRVDAYQLSRWDTKERFFNRITMEVEEVEAGIVGRFISNPEEFVLPDGSWAKTKQTFALRKMLGRDLKPEDLLTRFEALIPIGRGQTIADAMKGLVAAKQIAPEEFKDLFDFFGAYGRGVQKNLMPSSQTLQRTPLFRPLVEAGVGRSIEKTAWRLKIHDALGGEINDVGERLMDLMVTGGSGFKLKETSPLMPRRHSLLSPARLKPKAAARELNDQLVIALGDDFHLDAVNTRRAKDGLAPISRADIGEEVYAKTDNLRVVLDEMFGEAVRLGLVDPVTFNENYLPRIYRGIQRGNSQQEMIRAIRKGDGPVSMEADPFFSFSRKPDGDPEGLVTDLMEMLDAYTSALTRHKYLKPVVNDITKLLTSSKVLGDVISPRDAQFALEFLHTQLGGTSRLEAATARAAQRHAENLVNLIDEKVRPQNFGEWLEAGAEWFGRQVTDLWYTNYIGFKIGLPLRNFTQQALGIPMMGRGAVGWNHLRRGTQRMVKDPALYQTYLEHARRWNWHNDYYDFADHTIGRFQLDWPDLMSERYKKTLMAWYQVSDMQNRVNVWGGGFDYAEDVVSKVMAGKSPNWKNSAKGFTAEERTTLSRLLAEERFDEFKAMYADAVVNNSQWLYNRKNRPLWLQKNPLVGLGLVFLTWPMNFGAVMGRANTAGMKMSGRGMEMARWMKNGLEYLAPMTLVGFGLEYGGRAAGMGGMSDWLMPELEEFPGGKDFKRRMGFESEEKAIVPIPIKPLLLGYRTLSGDEPLGGSLPVLRLWFEGAAAAKAVTIGGDPEESQRARKLQQVGAALPLTAQGLQPFWNEVGLALGLEPDVDFREGIFQEIIAAMLQMRESEGMEADWRRAQALPKIPGEQERNIVGPMDVWRAIQNR